jgi:DNA (cytosine-5)-methyltransferase 1
MSSEARKKRYQGDGRKQLLGLLGEGYLPNAFKLILEFRSTRMSVSVAAIDLFCGIGGLTHGIIKAGIPVVAGVDTDKTCRYAFEKNNNTVFINRSVRSLTAADLDKMYATADIKILVGCAPCQCFSKHTQKCRTRRKDAKWKLLYSFSDLATSVKPDIVSMENVGEIQKHKVFRDFIEALSSAGYCVFSKVVYCPDYGIPQNRRRLVLLASKLGKIVIVPPTHPRSRCKTVRDAIGKLEEIEDGGCSSKDRLHATWHLSPTNKKRIRQSVPGGTWLDWDEDLRAACHKKESEFSGDIILNWCRESA